MTQQQKTKNEVATKKTFSVTASTVDLSVVAQDQGKGLAAVDMESTAIPFLKILS